MYCSKFTFIFQCFSILGKKSAVDFQAFIPCILIAVYPFTVLFACTYKFSFFLFEVLSVLENPTIFFVYLFYFCQANQVSFAIYGIYEFFSQSVFVTYQRPYYFNVVVITYSLHRVLVFWWVCHWGNFFYSSSFFSIPPQFFQLILIFFHSSSIFSIPPHFFPFLLNFFNSSSFFSIPPHFYSIPSQFFPFFLNFFHSSSFFFIPYQFFPFLLIFFHSSSFFSIPPQFFPFLLNFFN